MNLLLPLHAVLHTLHTLHALHTLHTLHTALAYCPAG